MCPRSRHHQRQNRWCAPQLLQSRLAIGGTLRCAGGPVCSRADSSARWRPPVRRHVVCRCAAGTSGASAAIGWSGRAPARRAAARPHAGRGRPRPRRPNSRARPPPPRPPLLLQHREDAGPGRALGLREARPAVRAQVPAHALQQPGGGGVPRVPLQQRHRQVPGRGEARLLVRAQRLLVELRQGAALGRHEVRGRLARGRQRGPVLEGGGLREVHRGRRPAERQRRPVDRVQGGGGRRLAERGPRPGDSRGVCAAAAGRALVRLVAHDLVYPGGLLLAFDLDEIELAAEEPVLRRKGVVRRPGADHADAVKLAEALQATGQVDGIAQASKLHLQLATKVSAQHTPCVEAYAYC
mmetsp:Transcript_101361/g.295259  ORF Transcript_101361/g.295259 Transcript_101361/m.295259 type:complete len:354 (-) Transcript_101361:601-1662(-)